MRRIYETPFCKFKTFFQIVPPESNMEEEKDKIKTHKKNKKKDKEKENEKMGKPKKFKKFCLNLKIVRI